MKSCYYCLNLRIIWGKTDLKKISKKNKLEIYKGASARCVIPGNEECLGVKGLFVKEDGEDMIFRNL